MASTPPAITSAGIGADPAAVLGVDGLEEAFIRSSRAHSSGGRPKVRATFASPVATPVEGSSVQMPTIPDPSRARRNLCSDSDRLRMCRMRAGMSEAIPRIARGFPYEPKMGVKSRLNQCVPCPLPAAGRIGCSRKLSALPAQSAFQNAGLESSAARQHVQHGFAVHRAGGFRKEILRAVIGNEGSLWPDHHRHRRCGMRHQIGNRHQGLVRVAEVGQARRRQVEPLSGSSPFSPRCGSVDAWDEPTRLLIHRILPGLRRPPGLLPHGDGVGLQRRRRPLTIRSRQNQTAPLFRRQIFFDPASAFPD